MYWVTPPKGRVSPSTPPLSTPQRIPPSRKALPSTKTKPRTEMDQIREEFLSKLFEQTETMDVSFTFPNSELKIKAHKSVLATWSPVFSAMFYGPLKENEAVQIVDIKPDVFQKMINFLYCQPFKTERIGEGVDLQIAADKYDIPKLSKLVEEYFLSIITAVNVCEIYQLAVELKFSKVTTKSEAIFASDTKAVIESESFLQSSAETVNKIYCQTSIGNVTELDKYHGIENWITAQMAAGKEKEALKALVQPAIESIRYHTMDVIDICDLDLLSSDARLQIIKKIHQTNQTTDKQYKSSLLGILRCPDCGDYQYCDLCAYKLKEVRRMCSGEY